MRILTTCNLLGQRPRYVSLGLAQSNWRRTLKKLILAIFIVFITIMTLIYVVWNRIEFEYSYFEKRDSVGCFELPGNLLPIFDDSEPELGAGIFFHETSCPADMSDIPLNPRQACAVESALKVHPFTDVFLLISSPIFTTLKKTKNVYVRQLLSYRNFKLRHIKFSKYVSNTPLEVIYTTGALNESFWPVAHTSDVLRYTTLYKFGGIYLDLDVIVLRPLKDLRNFAGAESDEAVGSGILGFSYDNIGREVAQKCAQDLARGYDGTNWGHNGPGVITRVLQELCNAEDTPKMIKAHCKGFRVYPIECFSALSYGYPEFFFQEGNTAEAREILNKSFVIHYWNKLSSKYTIRDNQSDVPFLNYARKKCPKVYKACDGYF